MEELIVTVVHAFFLVGKYCSMEWESLYVLVMNLHPTDQLLGTFPILLLTSFTFTITKLICTFPTTLPSSQ
jgi:hypothetical protein